MDAFNMKIDEVMGYPHDETAPAEIWPFGVWCLERREPVNWGDPDPTRGEQRAETFPLVGETVPFFQENSDSSHMNGDMKTHESINLTQKWPSRHVWILLVMMNPMNPHRNPKTKSPKRIAGQLL